MKALALPALLGLAVPAFAQTDGTLASPANADWTTAPWTITSGSGSYPSDGGTATFLTPTGSTPGTVVPNTTTYTLDAPVTLAGIDFNTPFATILAGTSPNILTLASTGGTFRLLAAAKSSPSTVVSSITVNAPIAGGGDQGLGISGRGVLVLSGANTYTGGTRVAGGATLRLTNGDGNLGAVGDGNGITLDNGTLLTTNSAFTTARTITLGAGGGTIIPAVATTLNGSITGSGGLTVHAFSSASITLTAANTYTGATVLSAYSPGVSTVNPGLTLSGAGSIAASSSYALTNYVLLDNTEQNVNDRLSDTAPVALRGAGVYLYGNASVATHESIGAVTLKSGLNVLFVTPTATQSATLHLASLTREGASTLFVSGTNLGATPGPNVATITSAVAPTLVGGGGAAGSTSTSILPWASGNPSDAVTNSTLVTYDDATGFRLLAPSEYRGDFLGSAVDNVRITASAVAPATTVNALLFAPGASGQNLSGGPIAITSGAFLYSPTVGLSTSTVSADLAFGSAEGIVTASHGLVLSGAISGTGGLTLSAFSPSAPITLSGASTYTGTTTLVNGPVRFSGTIAGDGVTPGPFGLDTSAIVLRPESGTVALQSIANGTIFNRDLIVENTGISLAALQTVSAGNTLTVNGSISTDYPLSLLTAANAAGSAITLNGPISGSGMLTESSASYVVINRANTFTGGVNVRSGTWNIGADHALGTGTIFASGNGIIQSTNRTARTLSNGLQFVSTNVPSFRGTGSITLTGPVDLNGSATINVAMTGGAKTIFAGDVKNGALTKTGTGTLTLANPAGNTYPGGTLISPSSGTLEVNNSTGSGTGAGAVFIGPGSTLVGNFTISGATRIAGGLSPGAAEGGFGTANFGGDLTLAEGSTTGLEISSADLFDSIHVGGTLTLTSTSTIHVVTIGGYLAQWGETFQLLRWTSLTPAGFDPAANLNLSGAELAPGLRWDLTSFLTSGTITAVPEPRDTALAVVALLGTLALLRRRRAPLINQ